MILLDAQQRRLLERLRQPVSSRSLLPSCTPAGIDFPAAVVSELELNGYVIERVYAHGRPVGVRLLHPEPPDISAAQRRRRRAWPHR